MKARVDDLEKRIEQSLAEKRKLGREYSKKLRGLLAEHSNLIKDIIGNSAFTVDASTIYTSLKEKRNFINRDYDSFDTWVKNQQNRYDDRMQEFRKEEDEKRYGNLSYYDSQPGVEPVRPDLSEKVYNKHKAAFEDRQLEISEKFDSHKDEVDIVYRQLESLIGIDSAYQSVSDDVERLNSEISDIKDMFDEQLFKQLKNIASNRTYWQDKSAGLTSLFKGLPDTIKKVNELLDNDKLLPRLKYKELERIFIEKSGDGKDKKRAPELVEFQKILGKLKDMRKNLDSMALDKFAGKVNKEKSVNKTPVNMENLKENASPNKPKPR